MKGVVLKASAALLVICLVTAGTFFLDPEGFENFLIDNDCKINIDIDGRLHRKEAVFNHLAEGVEIEDRSYLAKKARLLHLIRVHDSDLAIEVSEFGKAMVDAAQDETLDKIEVSKLKVMSSDLVSASDVDNWYGISKELHENIDPAQGDNIILITNN